MFAHRRKAQAVDRPRLLAGHGGAVGRDGQVDRAPAVHARLGSRLVVIGDDEVDRHAVAQPLSGFVDRALGPLQLFARGHQLVAVEQGPVVVLDVGEFEVVDADVLGHRENLRRLVDVVAEHRHVEHHGETVGLDHPRHLQLQVEDLGPHQRVGQVAVTRLDGQLDLLEAGLFQRHQARLAQPDARGDQVGVVAQAVGLFHQLLQVVAQHRLTTGEAQLQRTQLAALAQHLFPFVGAQLRSVAGRGVHRVAAPRALQWAAVGQFEHEPQRLALAVKSDDGSILWHGTPPGMSARPLRRGPVHRDTAPAARRSTGRPCARRRSA